MANTHVRTEVQPRLVIERVDDALIFYRDAFGAELVERFVDASGVVVHAAIRIGTSLLTIAQEVKAWQLLGPLAIGGSPVLLHMTVEDPDATCARAVERGGVVVIPIKDRPYGKREGRIRDPFGHLWVLSCTLEALSAEEIQRRLGAAHEEAKETQMKVKRIVVDVAAQDPRMAKRFYEGIFGLNVLMDMGWIATYGSSQKMTLQLSFMTEGGSGAPVPDLSIEVDDLDAALDRVKQAKIPIEYGPTIEPWGVRRFFVRDPFGKLVNVLVHLP